VLLTNGRQWRLYRILFEKPVKTVLVFDFDLLDDSCFKKACKYFEYLTKKCVERGDLEKYWNKYIVIDPENLCKQLYEYSIVKLIKSSLKKKVGINFTDEDIFDGIHQIVTTKIDIEKPKLKK